MSRRAWQLALITGRIGRRRETGHSESPRIHALSVHRVDRHPRLRGGVLPADRLNRGGAVVTAGVRLPAGGSACEQPEQRRRPECRSRWDPHNGPRYSEFRFWSPLLGCDAARRSIGGCLSRAFRKDDPGDSGILLCRRSRPASDPPGKRRVHGRARHDHCRYQGIASRRRSQANGIVGR